MNIFYWIHILLIFIYIYIYTLHIHVCIHSKYIYIYKIYRCVSQSVPNHLASQAQAITFFSLQWARCMFHMPIKMHWSHLPPFHTGHMFYMTKGERCQHQQDFFSLAPTYLAQCRTLAAASYTVYVLWLILSKDEPKMNLQWLPASIHFQPHLVCQVLGFASRQVASCTVCFFLEVKLMTCRGIMAFRISLCNDSLLCTYHSGGATFSIASLSSSSACRKSSSTLSTFDNVAVVNSHIDAVSCSCMSALGASIQASST